MSQSYFTRAGRKRVLVVETEFKGDVLYNLKREAVSRVLADVDWNITHAATALGMHRQSLQRMIRHLKLKQRRGRN